MNENLKFLIGLRVRSNHPITCLNPAPTFIIHDVEIENGKLYVRGENTMWFGTEMIEMVD